MLSRAIKPRDGRAAAPCLTCRACGPEIRVRVRRGQRVEALKRLLVATGLVQLDGRVERAGRAVQKGLRRRRTGSGCISVIGGSSVGSDDAPPRFATHGSFGGGAPPRLFGRW